MRRRVLIVGACGAMCALLWLATLRPCSTTSRPAGPLADSARAPSSLLERHAKSAAVSAGRTPAAPVAGRSGLAQGAESSDEARARLARQSIEQRSVGDVRHAERTARWPRETREEPWSTDREGAFRAAVSAGGLDHLLIDVECRRTLCRLELSAADSNTAYALRSAGAFTELLGLDASATMVGAGPGRALEIFAARPAQGP